MNIYTELIDREEAQLNMGHVRMKFTITREYEHDIDFIGEFSNKPDDDSLININGDRNSYRYFKPEYTASQHYADLLWYQDVQPSEAARIAQDATWRTMEDAKEGVLASYLKYDVRINAGLGGSISVLDGMIQVGYGESMEEPEFRYAMEELIDQLNTRIPLFAEAVQQDCHAAITIIEQECSELSASYQARVAAENAQRPERPARTLQEQAELLAKHPYPYGASFECGTWRCRLCGCLIDRDTYVCDDCDPWVMIFTATDGTRWYESKGYVAQSIEALAPSYDSLDHLRIDFAYENGEEATVSLNYHEITPYEVDQWQTPIRRVLVIETGNRLKFSVLIDTVQNVDVSEETYEVA